MLDELRSKARHWRLFAHTGRNMTAEQLFGALERKCRHAVVPRLPVNFEEWYDRRVPESLAVDHHVVAENNSALRASLSPEERRRYRSLTHDALDGTFRFVETLSLGDRSELPWEWDHPTVAGLARPGRSDLHGFLPVSWAVRGFDKLPEAVDDLFAQWVRDWRRCNEIGEAGYLRRSWTPYTVSLRVRHLSRLVAWRASSSLPTDERLRRAVFENALFLERHVESDVDGNHLAENGIALAFAGLLFGGHQVGGHDAARRWLDLGVDVLGSVAREQFLDDGGHFERSTMYHVLVVTRLVTAINLLETADVAYPEAIREAASEGVAFVADIRGPDGRIPVLNDAVRGRSLSPSACLGYAERVGLDVRAGEDALADSGYYWFGSGGDRLLVDGGPVGPPKLPGHSHNDLLQILAWFDGRPVVTDTGVLRYEPDAARQYARSVRGHNTVQVGNTEPIDIGGRFLMGRRTEPTTAYAAGDDVTAFDGRYTVRSGDRRYRHRRRVVGDTSWWLVWDDVQVDRPETVHSRLHLHPDVTPDLSDGSTRVRLTDPDGLEAWVYPLGVDTVVTGTGWYFPRFGERVPRPVLNCRVRGTDRASFGYLLSAVRRHDVAVETTDGTASAVSVDGRAHPLPEPTRLEDDSP